MRLIKMAIIIIILGSASCSAISNDTINLSDSEKVIVQGLAERMHELQVNRQKIQMDYDSKVNRLNEEQATIQLEENSLCYQFQKAHKLDMGTRYNLDIWKGELIKVGKVN